MFIVDLNKDTRLMPHSMRKRIKKIGILDSEGKKDTAIINFIFLKLILLSVAF